MGRNTFLLREIINVLTDQVFNAPLALRTLEQHFQDRLIVNVGNTTTIKAAAKQLRLVLDYIGQQDMVGITVERCGPSRKCIAGRGSVH